MDVNGQRHWMLSETQHWLRDDQLDYDSERRCLRLASQRRSDEPVGEVVDETEATNRIHLIPQTIDSYETRARWNGDTGEIVATGALPDSVTVYAPDSPQPPTDLAMGFDGILYVAVDGMIELQDRRNRFAPARVRLENFSAWRLAANVDGGVWVLDRANRLLARLHGEPFPYRPFVGYKSFRPSPENPNPPKLTWIPEATWSAGEDPIAISAGPDGTVVVLNWIAIGGATISWLRDGQWRTGIRLSLIERPYSLAWVDPSHIAVLVNGTSEAFVYEVPVDEQPEEIRPLGDFYPLRNHSGGPFFNGVTFPPHYPTDEGSAVLHRLSLPAYASSGIAHSATRISDGSVARVPLDGNTTQMAWHRIYLEAAIPDGCGIRVFLSSSNSSESEIDDSDWHEHRFGQKFEPLRDGVPRGVWMAFPSEIPFSPGFVSCPPVAERTGLFNVLVQRSNRPVRTMQGRYLHLRVELEGNGHSTPEIWALRVYGSRFSYRDRYLPELFREQLFGPDADEIVETNARSTPADFLDRLLQNFEGILTLLEDRIAQSWLLTDPRSTSDESLDWHDLGFGAAAR